MFEFAKAKLEHEGRVWVRGALSVQELDALQNTSAVGTKPGKRIDWDGEVSRHFLPGSTLGKLADSLLPGAFPVRLVAFDKTPETNWSVPWHQDRVIAVSERHDTAGFKNWARKSGVWHTEPPISLLEHMVFARVHFDDTDETNGCLQLSLGSHGLGLVKAEEAAQKATFYPVEICEAKRGDVLFVKALTMHRSLSSRSSTNRRALRVDFANFSLPEPLGWAYESANTLA